MPRMFDIVRTSSREDSGLQEARAPALRSRELIHLRGGKKPIAIAMSAEKHERGRSHELQQDQRRRDCAGPGVIGTKNAVDNQRESAQTSDHQCMAGQEQDRRVGCANEFLGREYANRDRDRHAEKCRPQPTFGLVDAKGSSVESKTQEEQKPSNDTGNYEQLENSIHSPMLSTIRIGISG